MTSKAIAAFVLLAGFALADVVERTEAPGFVELSAGNVAADADVSWEPRKPFDLPYREYVSLQGHRVCVLYLKPGKYSVLCDVIDWDAKRRTKRTYVITVKGDVNPDPVNPDPVDPVNPVEPELKGLAGQVYRAAKAVALPKEVAAVCAMNFESTASAIAAGGVRTVVEAQAMLERLNKVPRSSQPLWQAVDNYLAEFVKNDIKKAEAAFLEIAKGLKAIK